MPEINNIPKNWQLKKLGEVCEIMTGTTPPKSDTSNYGNDIPFFKPPHLWDGLISDTGEKLSFKGAEKARVVPPNTVLVTCIGNLGRTGFLKKKAAFNQQLNAILENENIGGKFIFYQAQSPLFRKQLEKLATGTTVSIVNKGNFETIIIPLPPLPEQQAIVAKIEELFSELDNGIVQLKTAQQQLKVYRQSLLKWAFEGKLTNKNVKDGELPKGWKWVKIGEVSKCIVPNRDKPKSFTGNIKWVTTPNLSTESIRLDYSNIPMGLSETEVKKYNARVIPVGSVVMTCVGNFGLSAIVEKPVVINQQLHAFIPNENVNSKYLAYCIQYSKNYFNKKSTSTTVQYLNKENCNSMPFPFCSLKEQQLIVDELESKLTVCDKIQETISQSLQQAETLRQSILKKAFEGKLVKFNTIEKVNYIDG